jgi:hypothetical protein
MRDPNLAHMCKQIKTDEKKKLEKNKEREKDGMEVNTQVAIRIIYRFEFAVGSTEQPKPSTIFDNEGSCQGKRLPKKS